MPWTCCARTPTPRRCARPSASSTACPRTASREEAYRDAYVTGLAHVIAAAAAGRARRLVFVSSTGVFGQDDGSVVDESSPAIPKGFSGRIHPRGRGAARGARRSRPRPSASPASTARGATGSSAWCARARRCRRSRARPSPTASTATTARAPSSTWSEQPAVQPLYLGSDEAPDADGRDPRLDRRAAGPADRRPWARTTPEVLQRGGNKRISSARLRGEGFRFLYPTYREGFAAILGRRGARGLTGPVDAPHASAGRAVRGTMAATQPPEGAHDLGQTQLRIRKAQARTGAEAQEGRKAPEKMQNKQAKEGDGADAAPAPDSDTPPA